MAIAAATVFEVRTGGSDTNGGGFKTGASGTDHTLQDAAQYAVTDGVTAGTTTITSATANFGTDVVGNLIYVQGGTGSVAAGWYEITARGSATSITVDRSTGLTAGTGVTLNIGGALATPGLAASLATVSGNTIYVKSGTYTMSTATPGAGGPVLFASAIRVAMIGYQTTRGDDTGTRPILSWGAVASPGATSYLYSGQGNAAQVLHNLEADGNDVTNVSGFLINNARWSAVGCRASNCSTASQVGFLGTGSRGAVQCSAVDCTTGFSNGQCVFCVADTCGDGFSGTLCISCIAWDCTDDGFVPNANGALFINCTAYSNDGDGFDASTNIVSLVNCAAVLNGGYGFNGSTNLALVNCADYNNTSGRLNGTNYHLDHDPIAMTGDPFDGAASDDFRPDNTASQGALLRAAGLPVFGQTDNRDVGAVQHADSAGGGGILRNAGFSGGFVG